MADWEPSKEQAWVADFLQRQKSFSSFKPAVVGFLEAGEVPVDVEKTAAAPMLQELRRDTKAELPPLAAARMVSGLVVALGQAPAPARAYRKLYIVVRESLEKPIEPYVLHSSMYAALLQEKEDFVWLSESYGGIKTRMLKPAEETYSNDLCVLLWGPHSKSLESGSDQRSRMEALQMYARELERSLPRIYMPAEKFVIQPEKRVSTRRLMDR